MSPPGPEKDRALTTIASAQEWSEQRDPIIAPAQIKAIVRLLAYQDWCIEDWIEHLEGEHHRLGAGSVGLHMLHCLRARYAEWLCSGSQKDRYRTWVTIQTLAAWLKELEGRENESLST